MLLTDQTLLRLHLEAVWNIQLPVSGAHSAADIELLGTGVQPPWKLYVADLAAERVHIWRPGINEIEREALLSRAEEVLLSPVGLEQIPGVSREVALAPGESSRLDVVSNHNLAHLLTPLDRSLVETFQPGSADYYFRQEARPLVGVIVDGQLLSLAHSSRRTKEACELGIDTLPQARRHGYALAATRLWTQTVLQEGLVPLYSAFAENIPSLHLAAAAGYRIFARGANFADNE